MSLILSWWRLLKKLILWHGLRVVQPAKSHMKSTCWNLKSQVLGCISQVTNDPRNSLTRWFWVWLLYPSPIICTLITHKIVRRLFRKKTLEQFLQHTHLVRESYSSLSENSFIVSSPSHFPLLYLERGFVLKHNPHILRV